MKNRNIDIAILVLTVVACAIPFLGQPFHMDDGLYLDLARNVQKNPFFPNDLSYMFQGLFWQDMGSHSHPPFQTYFLSVILHFFGEGIGTEWIYHSFALFFPSLAVVSFYWICARFVQRPLWPSMLLACSPLLLVMQHNLMTDVPMLAFWLAAISCFLWATQLRSTILYGLSTVFQVAAVFTSYQSIVLAPLLGFYQFRKGRGPRGWLSLAVAPVAIVAWYAINCLHYQRPLWASTLGYVQSRSPLAMEVLGTKLLSILEYQGWLIIFPFFILYLLARDLKWRSLILVLLVSAYLAQLRISEYRWMDKGIFVVGLTAGIFVVLEMAKVAWSSFFRGRETLGFDRVEGQFIGLWYFGFFFYCLIFLTEGSARYILPMLPPFLLCFFRVLEMSEILEYRLPRRLINSAMLASGSLAISLFWGLALSRADLEFAEIYPRAAAEFSRVAGALKSYSVGEWGFRYYLGRLGAQPLPADTSHVRGGSFLVIPKLAQPNEIPANLGSISMPVHEKSYRPATPLRVLDWQTPAGFYSTGWGLIPFSFSWKDLEEVRILQVSFMAEQLPWAEIETVTGIKPWPGQVALHGESRIAILAKPGTRMRYPWSLETSARLELECGVSMDSYKDGSDEAFQFEVSYLDREGKTLAERRLTLHPGSRKEDRGWHPIGMPLTRSSEGVLEFRYSSTSNRPVGTGAFAQSLIRPVD
jgi:4-amino-4-deoxy-L-arabinose transferase-like glycosyltransferase